MWVPYRFFELAYGYCLPVYDDCYLTGRSSYTGALELCAQPKFIALSIALGIAPSIK